MFLICFKVFQHRPYRIIQVRGEKQNVELSFDFSLLPLFIRFSGRATLVSGPKRQSTTQNAPISNINRNSVTTASSPTFGAVENIRRYSLSRTHSDQNSQNPSRTSTPSRSRRTSTSDSKERLGKIRSLFSFSFDHSFDFPSFVADNLKTNAPKSLLEWHEQPANLLEQPPLSDKVNVQILSPNAEHVKKVRPMKTEMKVFVFIVQGSSKFYLDRDLSNLSMHDNNDNGSNESRETD